MRCWFDYNEELFDDDGSDGKMKNNKMHSFAFPTYFKILFASLNENNYKKKPDYTLLIFYPINLFACADKNARRRRIM